MKLVIAEKPSVAQSLAAVIGATARKDGYLEGGGWRVSWCVGHLAGLADADAYNPDYAKWRYDDLPILPEPWQMVVSKDKKKQFDVLKQLMNAPDVTEVVNACDAGREGELIFRSVYELAGCQKPMKRLWISSMEDSAIREGFANLRPGADYDGLRDAALCRAKADWLVGINATRLFSVLYHRTLNIGRVMSPTLAPEDFMAGISAMLKELVGTYQAIKGTEYLFSPSHEVVGKCPRCGGEVAEMQKGFFCQTESCKFAIWKNNKWWEMKHKQPTKAIVTALLKDGRAHVRGLYSEKTGKTYDATVVLADDGQYANFKLEFDQQKGGKR